MCSLKNNSKHYAKQSNKITEKEKESKVITIQNMGTPNLTLVAYQREFLTDIALDNYLLTF